MSGGGAVNRTKLSCSMLLARAGSGAARVAGQFTLDSTGGEHGWNFDGTTPVVIFEDEGPVVLMQGLQDHPMSHIMNGGPGDDTQNNFIRSKLTFSSYAIDLKFMQYFNYGDLVSKVTPHVRP